MSWFRQFEYFNSHSPQRQELKEIATEFPDNQEIATHVLQQLGNSTTKIIHDKDIKNSYYVYLNDTIYLSGHQKNTEDYSRIVLISHECRHAMQAKCLQTLNFLFSNLELLGFVIATILCFLHIIPLIAMIVYVSIVFINILLRVILETDAIRSAIKIAKEYAATIVDEQKNEKLQKAYRFQSAVLYPVLLFQLFIWKLVRVDIILLLCIR